MRRRPALFIGLILLGLALVAAYVVWAIYAASKIGFGWQGLHAAWPYLLAGVLTVACAIGGFVWLAFFSERRGYDDRAGLDRR